jgi:ABC-type transporter Mla subunit MlaD
VNERRRRDASVLSSPVLIGALTVLVVIIAVALAYNANTGLPFVPTYDLHVQAADASELQKGDDVNLGGALVGIVGSVTPSRTHSGRPIALLNLKLYKNIEPLPSDTRFTVRLKGAIGLKYLDVSLGHARTNFANNATVPLSHSGTSVDFDQVLSMFNPKTRKGVNDTTIGFGQALAGRGYDLNHAISRLGPLFANLAPVAANLASPNSNLAGFFRGLERFSGALEPVAATQAALFGNLDTTFTSLAGVAPSLSNTISATPHAFDATIQGSPTIRPFLTDTASLLHQLSPGFATLKTSAPLLASAFATGRRTLPPTAALDNQTVLLSQKLESFSANPAVEGGLKRLTKTAGDLRKPLAFLTPVQATCNYPSLFLRNVASTLSEHVSDGSFLRFVQVSIQDIPGVESEPSHKLYTGKTGHGFGPVHANAFPNTASPGQIKECSAGNEPFPHKLVIGNPPGNVGLTTQKTTRPKSVVK